MNQLNDFVFLHIFVCFDGTAKTIQSINCGLVKIDDQHNLIIFFEKAVYYPKEIDILGVCDRRMISIPGGNIISGT